MIMQLNGELPDEAITKDPAEQDVLRRVTARLLGENDKYLVLPDFADFARANDDAMNLYASGQKGNQEWARRALLNIAGSGFFSSDRTIGEYSREIWGVKPV